MKTLRFSGVSRWKEKGGTDYLGGGIGVINLIISSDRSHEVPSGVINLWTYKNDP